MDSEALKPCPVPWCGRNAELKGDDDIYFTEPPSAIVVCTECGLETPIFETHAEAITAWNTRAEGSEAQAKTIEALQADNAKLRAALAPFVDFWEWDTIKTFMDYPVSQCFTPATFLRAVKTFHETSETFTRSSDT